MTGNVFHSEHIEATPYMVSGQAKASVVFQGNAVSKKRKFKKLNLMGQFPFQAVEREDMNSNKAMEGICD